MRALFFALFLGTSLFVQAHVCASYEVPEVPMVSYKRLMAVSNDHTVIELDDGSKWTVDPSHASYVKEWDHYAPVVISPNSNPISSYAFYITNKDQEVYVSADLRTGPILGTPMANRIIDINYDDGEIITENGQGFQTAWHVDSFDKSLMKSWKLNQTVIVGAYDGFLSSWVSRCQSILINVEALEDTFIRAQEY